ncbi:MAG: hypothetical protein WD069_06145 [Planctomycetales bacterium]
MSAVLLVSRDLLFVSRVEGAARRIGVRCDAVDDAAQAAAKLAPGDFALVLCDLTAPGTVADLIAAISAAATTQPRPRVIAFGPHVHVARLEEARAAGCDEVLTRGKFDATLDAILARHLAG